MSSAPLRLDSSACDRCLLCVPVCEPRALRIGPGYISVDWETCTGCGKCATVCAPGAISLKGAAAQGQGAHAAKAASTTTGKHAAPAAPTAKPVAKPKAPKKQPASEKPARVSGLAGAVAWTLPEGALSLLVTFALLLGVQALPATVATAPVWAGVTLFAYDVAIGLLLYFLVRRRGVSVAEAFRFDTVPRVTDMLYAVAVAVGCWLFSVLYRALAMGMGLTPPTSEGIDLTRLFGPGVAGIVATVLVVAIAGPLLEEVLLRGVVLGAVARKVGSWPAVIVCALAFALLHASLWSLLPLTVLGIGLGWLAVRSRSLVPAVVAHVLYNVVFVAAAFYAAR